MKPRLLVIELHHLGDAVLALPFLWAASARYEVGIFCTKDVAAMLQSFVPGLETKLAAPGWPGRFFQAAMDLKKWRPAVTVCAWSDARAHLVARLSGAPQRVGFPVNEVNFYAPQIPWRRRRLEFGRAMEGAAQRAGHHLLTDALQRGSVQESHLNNWHRIADALGISLSLDPPWFDISTLAPPQELHAFIKNQKQNGRPLWVLHAGGRLATKRWPVERFAKLLRNYFAEKNLPVLILGSPGEEIPKPASALQKTWACSSHRELAALLNCADSVLCNDSYPAHLAAALGKPVFSIFGSGEPAWFSAFGNSHRVIRKPACPHHPCIDRCVMPSIVCLEAVTVEDVAAFLDRN